MSDSKAEVFTPLTGAIQLKEGLGITTLNRGDAIPFEDLAEGEEERLRGLGAIGSLEPAEAPISQTEHDLLAGDVAAKLAAGEDFTPREVQTTMAAVAPAPDNEPATPGAGEQSRPGAPTLESSNEDFDAYTGNATVEQIVAHADSPEMAQALLESEEVVAKRDERQPRKGLVEGLVAKGAKPAEPEGSSSSG